MNNKINSFFHCKKCLEELPMGKSPRDFCRNEVGWTEKGIQVWCIRHEENVLALDFEGQKVGYEEEVLQ